MNKDIKKHKAKWFRIATAGDTTDGRAIAPEWIAQMADSYDPKIYGARVNVEHWRSIFPDSAFGSYGDVLALKTDTVMVGDDERLALFGLIQPNDYLIALNAKNQKIYTSVEIDINFAKTGKAYLVGLAVTDSPASLGTEMLSFAAKATQNPLSARKQRPDNVFGVATLQNDFNFEISTFENITDKIKGLFIKVDNHTQQTQDNFAQSEQALLVLAEEVAKQIQDLQTQFADEIGKLPAQCNEVVAKAAQLSADFDKLKDELHHTPAHSSRPQNAGSFTQIIDC